MFSFGMIPLILTVLSRDESLLGAVRIRGNIPSYDLSAHRIP